MSRERVLAVAARVEASWDALAADPAVVIDADAVEQAIGMLDQGDVRVAGPMDRASGSCTPGPSKPCCSTSACGLEVTGAGPFEYHDLPTEAATTSSACASSPRPLATARLSPGVVLMPSYVNIGAWVGPGPWSTPGPPLARARRSRPTCISRAVGIGGVLEPVQAAPVVIEDGSFIGSRCIVVEGVRVEARAVLGAGVVLTAEAPVIDVTGPEPVEHRGRVAGAVVIPGNRARSSRQATSGSPAADHRAAVPRDRRQGAVERDAARLRVVDGVNGER